MSHGVSEQEVASSAASRRCLWWPSSDPEHKMRFIYLFIYFIMYNIIYMYIYIFISDLLAVHSPGTPSRASSDAADVENVKH